MKQPIPVRIGKGRKGFTLLELLTVAAIMIVVMSFAVPSLRGMLDNTAVTRAGQVVGDQINLARQIASTTSASIEVRLIQIPSLSRDGYSALQIWGPNKKGVVVPLRNAMTLPRGMVISGNVNISPAVSSSLPQPLTTGTMPAGPGVTANAPYISFQIRPTGVVLPIIAMKDFCFSVVPARQATNTPLPANYVTIQVNPLTASPFMYRP